MKVFALVVILFAVLFVSPVLADNNVYILENTVSQFCTQPCMVSVVWDNEYTIIKANIALTISASGGMVAWFEDGMFILDQGARLGTLADCLEWSYRFAGPEGQPDTVLVMAGSFDPPTHNGIPPGSGEPVYYLGINWDGDCDDYYIYIDSVAGVSPDDGWLWEDSTFIFDPTFNMDGSSHEIHHVFYGCPPGVFADVPDNDVLKGYHCTGANFTYSVFYDVIPGFAVELFEVLSGPGTITKTGPLTGFYEMPPDTPGTYPVTIRAWSACCFPDFYTDYSFTVNLIQPCGDANGDCLLNVSDAVAIINYIFIHGDPPNPLCMGDANGDSTVALSDAVYIINYVFVGGAPPDTWCCGK